MFLFFVILFVVLASVRRLGLVRVNLSNQRPIRAKFERPFFSFFFSWRVLYRYSPGFLWDYA